MSSDYEYESEYSEGISYTDGLDDGWTSDEMHATTESDEPLYEVLQPNDLLFTMNQTIQEMECLTSEVNKTEIRLLLNHCKWDKELLMERLYSGPNEKRKLFAASKLSERKQKKSANIRRGEFTECEICYDNELTTLMVCLPCGHIFCKECVKLTLKESIMVNRNQVTPCPCYGCDEIIEDDLVMNILTDKTVRATYLRLVTDCYVQTNLKMGWCPGADCNRIFKVKSQFLPSVDGLECPDCKFISCFKCKNEIHIPIDCNLLAKWKKKNEDDSETSHWINANTKECPKCKSTIEKNGGCNHIVCRSSSCKYEFCWICLGAWDTHGNNWYNCTKYQEEASKKAQRAQEISRSSLKRYLFYFERYANHLNSLKLENEIPFDEICARLQAPTDNEDEEEDQDHEDEDVVMATWSEQQMLMNACRVLKDCRTTLMYTYVFAFYLQDDNQSAIFEGNQADLQNAVEQLSGFLEREVHKSRSNHRMKIMATDKTKYCETRRTVLVKHVNEGFNNNTWKFRDI